MENVYITEGVRLNNNQRTVSAELRTLTRRIHRFIENSPNKKQIDSVTGTNGWIIAYLSCKKDADVFQRDVEKEFDITRSTASKVINLMEQKGLVERQKVSSDARLRKLSLTPKAAKLSALFEKDQQILEDTLTKGFTAEEKQNLYEYIKRMKNNLGVEGDK